MAAVATALLFGALTAPFAVQAQNPPPFSTPLPMCAVPPSPETDTWPQAVTDSLGSTAGMPVTFSGASLVGNDIGASLTIRRVGPASSNGGTITGTDPFTFTPAAGYVGADVFPYEIVDAAARATVGLVRITITADSIPPTVSIASPLGGTVFGSVLVRASAADNAGVAGVSFFDGTQQIGTEVTAAPFQTTWATTLVGDGSHSLTATARDGSGNTATSAAVVVNVSNIVIVPNVVGLTQSGASSALSLAGLSLGAVTTANSATPAGQVISENPAAGSNAARGSAVSIVVSLGPAALATPTVDKMVFSQGAGKRTTPLFSTAGPGEMLVAFASSDGPASAGSQTLTITGAGLTWTRVQRAASRFGVSEIWQAAAPAVLTNVTVASTQAVGGVDQSLTVVAFKGVGGIGASNAAGAASGASTVSLLTQAAGSVVYAAGNDWDRAVARTIPAGQTKVREFVDTGAGDTFWVQAASGPSASIGATVTLNTTAPTNDQWNLAIVELTPGAAPVSVTVPTVTGLTQTAAQSAITGAGLTNGAVTTANSATVPAGQVISQNPLAGASAAPGSAVAIVVSLGVATGGPVVETTVFADGTGPQTTPAFSTAAAGDVLLAFATSDGPVAPAANNQNLTVSGAGLTWTRVQRAATSRGVAEIWTATAPAALSGATVSVTQSVTVVLGAAVNQSLTVVAFTGTSGVGASNVGGQASGAPTVSVAAQAAGSVFYAVGNDFDRAIARTIPAGQTKVHEFLAPTGDTFWVQSGNTASAAAGTTVTLNATAPTNDQWNFAIVELKR